MKKKIFLTLMALAVLATALVGCSWNEVTGISLKGDFDTEFTLYDQLNPADITLEVTFKDGDPLVIKGDATGVTITGFSTQTATANGKMVIRYRGASLEVPYTVVGEASNINTQNGLEVALKGDVPIINLADGTYNMALIGDITRSVILRATGDNVVLVDTVVAVPASAGVTTVEFRGLTLTNTEKKEAPTLTVTSAREVAADAATEALDAVVLEGCTVKGVGNAYGVKMDDTGKNVNLTVNNSQFVTENLAQDYFNYMIKTAADKHVNSLITFTNNVVECNVWYGLGSISNLVMTGNVVDSKLTASTELKDSAMAPLFNLAKNPVWFHTEPTNSGTYRMTITNNTFRNLENLFRVYQFDEVEKTFPDFVFRDNTLYNINYLVNYSTNSHGSFAFENKVVAGSLGVVAELDGYSNVSKNVVQNNSTLTIVGDRELIVSEVTEPGKVVRYVADIANPIQSGNYLQFQVKNTNDAANRYVYLGYAGAQYFAKAVYQDDAIVDWNYFKGTFSYSADGKDNVVFTNETEASIKTLFKIA